MRDVKFNQENKLTSVFSYLFPPPKKNQKLHTYPASAFLKQLQELFQAFDIVAKRIKIRKTHLEDETMYSHVV